MTESLTEKCSSCGREITLPIDDITKQDYEEFKATGSCKKCSTNSAFREMSETLKKNKLEAEQEFEKTIHYTYTPIPIEYEITKDHPFCARELADTIRKRPEYRIKTDLETDVLYFWSEKTGIYQRNGEKILAALINDILHFEATTRKISEVIGLLKIDSRENITSSRKIAVKNGILSFDPVALQQFTPEEFIINQLDVEYQKDTKSDSWMKFLEEVLPEEDSRLLLQEFMGSILICGCTIQKMLWMYGPLGRNGKGAIVRTVCGILGPENYSAVSLDDLDGRNRFAPFELKHSLINVSGEPRTNRKLSIELIQSLTGGDFISAERKGVQERFRMQNQAKLVTMGNHFPDIQDPTNAWWERIIVITFSNTFTGAKQIADIERQWLSDPVQRSAILNWMIEGRNRLVANNFRFTTTKSQEEMILQFKRASDSISSFITEAIILDLKTVTSKAELQQHYVEYCDSIGTHPQQPNKLNIKLAGLKGVQEASTRIGYSDKTKVWKGISLKSFLEDSEEPVENTDKQLTLDESGTSGTSGTSSIPRQSFEVKNKEGKKVVPAVPLVPNVPSGVSSENVESYRQLVCVFCQKGIMDNDWMKDDFSWNKSAHKLCYDVRRSELAVHDKGEGF